MGRSDVDLSEIKREYKAKYGKELAKEIEEKTSMLNGFLRLLGKAETTGRLTSIINGFLLAGGDFQQALLKLVRSQ